MLGRRLVGNDCAGAALVIALVKGLTNTVNANSIFVIVVEDVAVLTILVVVIFIALLSFRRYLDQHHRRRACPELVADQAMVLML